jgi:hypothetical protein
MSDGMTDPYAPPPPVASYTDTWAQAAPGAAAAPGQPAQSSGRRPGPGECAACGCSPAAPLQLKRHSGYVLMSRTWTERASYCQGCATDAYRRCQNWNLTRGWWGFVSTILNITCLLGNQKAFHALRGMPPAHNRDPQVVTPRQQPSNGGSSLWARSGVWATLGFVVLLFVLFGGLGQSHA